MSFLLFFFLALDSALLVPPSSWKAMAVYVKGANSTVECSFAVQGNGSPVRAYFLTKNDSAHFNRNRRLQWLYASDYAPGDHFRVHVAEPGEYALLIDNRLEGRNSAKVVVRVSVSEPDDVRVRTLDASAQKTVVIISLLLFLSITVPCGWYIAKDLMGR